MRSEPWKTAITKIEPNKIVIRGFRLDQLIGKLSFPQMIYLLIKGELPTKNVGKILDAILVSSIDHGVTPPSCQTAIKVASTGGSLNASISAGILAINEYHGGAIEQCMKTLQAAVKLTKTEKLTVGKAAEMIVREAKRNNKKIMGFGHRIHKNDPRTVRLYKLATELGISSDYIETSLTIQKALKKIFGKELPINVDGAIAAILCELNIPTELANAFFIISRTPGLVAHIHEEKTKYRPMRKINFSEAVYDGPDEMKI
jgi:citrate synthase